jgi:hypothetical protein
MKGNQFVKNIECFKKRIHRHDHNSIKLKSSGSNHNQISPWSEKDLITNNSFFNILIFS